MSVAVLSIMATVAVAATNPKVMGSVAVEWNDIPVKQEEVRAVRQFDHFPVVADLELTAR